MDERTTLPNRLGDVDGVFCFALIHHLVIGRNIPLDAFVRWVCGLAPRGLIEFVAKADPMVRGLLRHRENIFDGYDRHNFENIIITCASIVKSHQLSSTERVIYEFRR